MSNNQPQQQTQDQQPPPKPKRVSLRIVTEDEAKYLRTERQKDVERQKNLQLLLQLRPGVFEGEELAKHEELSRKMKYSVILVAFGFMSTTAFRVWQIKSANKDHWLGVAAILASYMPAMMYYGYWKNRYSDFLGEVSIKYKEKIRDDQLERFKFEGPAGNTLRTNEGAPQMYQDNRRPPKD